MAQMLCAGADLPPVTLLFTCRHQCELSILCNVLPHAGSHNCNVIVHYTGKDKLQPGTLNCILPDAASTFSDEHDMEEGNAQIAPKSTKKTPMHLRLPRMIDDRWLELTVWVTSTVAAWTMFVRNPLLTLQSTSLATFPYLCCFLRT